MRAIRVNKAGCQSAQEATQSTGSGLRRERGQTPLPWLLGVRQLGTCVWPSQAGCPRLCWASDSLLNRAAPCLEERGEEKGGGDLQARKRAERGWERGQGLGVRNTRGQGHQRCSAWMLLQARGKSCAAAGLWKHKRVPPINSPKQWKCRKKYLVQHQAIKVLLQLLTCDFETKNLASA